MFRELFNLGILIGIGLLLLSLNVVLLGLIQWGFERLGNCLFWVIYLLIFLGAGRGVLGWFCCP